MKNWHQEAHSARSVAARHLRVACLDHNAHDYFACSTVCCGTAMAASVKWEQEEKQPQREISCVQHCFLFANIMTDFSVAI